MELSKVVSAKFIHLALIFKLIQMIIVYFEIGFIGMTVINNHFIYVWRYIEPSEIQSGIFEINQSEFSFVIILNKNIVLLEVIVRENNVPIASQFLWQ